MTALLMLNIKADYKCITGTTWNKEEVENEQLTAKEACIS